MPGVLCIIRSPSNCCRSRTRVAVACNAITIIACDKRWTCIRVYACCIKLRSCRGSAASCVRSRSWPYLRSLSMRGARTRCSCYAQNVTAGLQCCLLARTFQIGNCLFFCIPYYLQLLLFLVFELLEELSFVCC